ncbi:hypothetical protein I5535_04585 [Rhodobacteraceae bacterium F11138]|nr:hypothetical protein [Rhodobacteraceae bacterium F11138]
MKGRETVKLLALVCGICVALLLPDDRDRQSSLPSDLTGPPDVQTLQIDSIG